MNTRLLTLPLAVEECHTVIKELHAMVHQLFERVEKLEKENRELRARLDLDSNNSSKPPSSDFKKKKNKKHPSGKSSGGQKGHPGHFRKLLDINEVDNVVKCKEFHKCKCGCEIIESDKYIRHQVYELPEIKLAVTEYQVAIGKCSGCSDKHIASLPEGVSWGITGARLTSFMSMSVSKYQLSRRALQEFLQEYFNFRISLGTVFNKQKLVNQILEKPVNALLPYIKQSKATNIDETSHRQAGDSHWLWTIASKTAAYFEVTKSRGKNVLRKLMHDFENNVISDRYAIYNYFDSSRRQICWAHLKRDFTRISQHHDKAISRIGKQLLACESELFQLWYQFKNNEITRENLLFQTAPIVKTIGESLEQGSYTAPELRAARFCKNLLENFSALWMFLHEEELEPTNNHAERCLRGLVIWRKKYFATQSNYGSEYIAGTASLIATSRLQKTNPFQYLSEAVDSHFSGKSILPIAAISAC